MNFIKTLKGRVEYVLKMYPATRDSDKELTIQLWKEYYPNRVSEVGGKEYIQLIDILDLPSQDAVKRVRAVVQNVDGRYLPSTWEIAKKRNQNESVWKKALGYELDIPVNPLRPVFGSKEWIRSKNVRRK